LIIGEVVIFLATDLSDGTRIDVRRHKPLGRVGSQFTDLGKLSSFPE